MWIVLLALRRPYTFIVMAFLILILGIVMITRMAVDIFPDIDIPVISVIWTYNGISAEEMAARITTPYERTLTTTVNDIEHIESQSLRGISVTKIYFQPGANVVQANAQVTAISQTLLGRLPPGTTPPLIIRYNATTVPVLQAAVSSQTLSEDQVNDLASNFIRTQLATVQGASILSPLGGKTRQIMIDIVPEKLQGHGLSPIDVSNAISAQNLILPAGTAKMGDREYDVKLNSSPTAVEAFGNIPIKQVDGATIYLKDVAQVRDGGAVQQSIVRQDGQRGVLMPVYKSGNASTLDIVQKVKNALPLVQAGLTKELNINLLFDQSIFVKAAVQGVLIEAAIASCLTGAMILLFLGSWRSTLIVTISIPLSILCSILVIGVLGYTLNVMTLGGLALAVGILVDDATVAIENIHRNIGMGKELNRAILDGSQQVATPAFVATLSICIVFVPVGFITGAAGYLFTPLALTVVFAMLASYVLSRTLVPTLIMYMLPGEVELYHHDEAIRDEIDADEMEYIDEAQDFDHQADKPKGDIIWRFHQQFNVLFERFRASYQKLLEESLENRKLVLVGFAVFVLASFVLIPFIGQDFFPQVDAGQFKLHFRAPAGTRIEETERLTEQVEQTIRQTVPPNEIATILDNIGLANSGIYTSYGDGSTIGSADAEILVSLNSEHHPTEEYIEKLRDELPKKFPSCTFFFAPSDIVTQILNFGLPAAIDVQVVGPLRNNDGNYHLARELESRIRGIPGAADVHLHQVIDSPVLNVNVDRIRASSIGLSQQDVARNLLISLSSSGQTSPNYFLAPNGVSYQVAIQTPQYKIDSIDSLLNTPITTAGNAEPQLLNNLADVTRGNALAVVNHYNVQPTFDIYASTQQRDLGGVASDIDRIISDVKDKVPAGSSIVVRGQVQSMRSSFVSLGFGLVFAVLLVYLLIVVNFQSWLDPFIILMALPGAMAGILIMLFVTQTTLSVPALMGSIMCVGVATANSILMVTFANDQRKLGRTAMEAALEAGHTRLRPVLMTALAMIFGMLPMSLGLGEGGEQNAPLGRAVIGGLLVATFTTLFVVPIIYSLLRQKDRVAAAEINEFPT